MIKNFFDYFSDKEEVKSILESVEQGTEYAPVEDAKLCPDVDFDWVEKDKVYDKLTDVILRKLESETDNTYYLYPTFVSINGERCALITFDNKALAVTHSVKSGNVVLFYDEFSLSKEKQVAKYVIRSEEKGISDMLSDMIRYMNGEKPQEVVDIKEAFLFESVVNNNSARVYWGLNPELREWLDKQIAERGITDDRDGRKKAKAWALEMMSSSDPNDKTIVQSCGSHGAIWYMIRRVVGEFTGPDGVTIHDPILGTTGPRNAAEASGRRNRGGNNAPQGGTTVSEDVDTEVDIESGQNYGETYDEWFERESKDYDEKLEEIAVRTRSICKYVKSRGKVEDSMFFPGLLILGKGGTGKSFTMEAVLEEMNMKKGVDYFNWGRTSTAADVMYDKFYQYNGKLILMDDAGGIFDTEGKVTFWKMALQTKKEQRILQIARTASDKKDDGKYYHVEGKSRRDRYLIEIGDRAKLVSNEMPRSVRTGTQQDREEWARRHDREVEEAERNAVPGIPDEFLFTGAAIIVGNLDEENIRRTIATKAGGAGNYDAVVQRLGYILQIDPPTRVIWSRIKAKIFEQRDSNRPDAKCLIPRADIDMFIEETEKRLIDNYTAQMNWRVAADIGRMLRGSEDDEEGRKYWKKFLDRGIKTGNCRDFDAANREMPREGAHL